MNNYVETTDSRLKLICGEQLTLQIQANYYAGILNSSPRVFTDPEVRKLWDSLKGTSLERKTDVATLSYEYRPLVRALADEFRLHRLDNLAAAALNLVYHSEDRDSESVGYAEDSATILNTILFYIRPDMEYLKQFVQTYAFLTPETVYLIKMGNMPSAQRYLANIRYQLEEAVYYLQPCVDAGDHRATEFKRYLAQLGVILTGTQNGIAITEPALDFQTLRASVIKYAISISPQQLANILFFFNELNRGSIITLYERTLASATKAEFDANSTELTTIVESVLKDHGLSDKNWMAYPWHPLLIEQTGYQKYPALPEVSPEHASTTSKFQ